MKLDPILNNAVRLARKGDYDQSIKTLENEENRYYGSFTYYYLLGLAYLHSKIFGRSLSYFRLAAEQKMRDPNTMLGLAALYLNHGDTDKAVDLYLEVQTLDESNKIAKKALRIIRKFPGPENISMWIDSGKLHSLFPPFPKAAIRRKKLALGILATAAGLALVLALSLGIFSLPSRSLQRQLPEGVVLAREEIADPVQTGGSYRYVLTRTQVLDTFNEAQRLFITNRDEAARLRLNRIMESNASDPVKTRASLLISYLETPRFDNLRDRFTYSEVINDPFIYRDAHIIWRGMASNLDVQQNHTSFDFLVGYDTHRVVEGIVQVDYAFAIPVNPERPVEILARVIPLSADREPRIRLQGIALNQAGLLDQP